MQLQWACPTCGSRLRADSALSLRRIRCPKCQNETIVPKPDAAPRPVAAPSPSATTPELSAELADDPLSAAISQAASEAADVPDWLSDAGIASSAVASHAPSPRASAIRKSAPKKKHVNLPLLITGGCVAACLIIGVICWASGAFDSGTKAVADADQPAGLPKLVFDWPAADRAGAIVEIDGTTYRVNEKGALEYELPPGQHKVVLRRLGFARIDLTFAPQKNGEQKHYKPEWKPALPGEQNDSVSGQVAATSSTNSGADKPVLESYPVFKLWETDFDKAQKAAEHDKKDILIAFFSADRRDWCLSVAQRLLTTKDFAKIADQHFELVLEEAVGKVAPDGSGMANLVAKYHVTSYPTLVLTDADGLPYARREYIDLNSESYMNMVKSYLGDRKKRDDLFAASEQGPTADSLSAAGKALDWLGEKNLIPYYLSKIHDWSNLADKVDPNNKDGTSEKFFLKELNIRLGMVDHTKPAELKPVLGFLEDWKKDHKFKDPDAAAKLHLRFAAMFGRGEEAATLVQEALDCKPNDREFRAYLEHLVEMIGSPVSSGSGFVCAEGGYILTNNHVVAGPGKLWVRVSGQKEVPAKVIAADESQDIALIQLDDTTGAAAMLKPLKISASPLGRGAEVGAFGYPLGDILGGEVKFTKGAISALPSKGTENMYLLQVEVNHGNSGGPLCNMGGQVVGIVSAKSNSQGGNDSYGMAIPAEVAIAYLKAHLPGYKGPPAKDPPKLDGWDKVDPIVSPSVLMIVKKMR